MVSWTKAQDVLDHVGAVVGTTEWPDVGSFRIRSGGCFDSRAADLTSVIV
jgi:hypothetical protein